MIEFNTKMDLMNTLKDSNQRAESWCREISAIDFCTRQGEVWSPPDNVDHQGSKTHYPGFEVTKDYTSGNVWQAGKTIHHL